MLIHVSRRFGTWRESKQLRGKQSRKTNRIMEFVNIQMSRHCCRKRDVRSFIFCFFFLFQFGWPYFIYSFLPSISFLLAAFPLGILRDASRLEGNLRDSFKVNSDSRSLSWIMMEYSEIFRAVWGFFRVLGLKEFLGDGLRLDGIIWVNYSEYSRVENDLFQSSRFSETFGLYQFINSREIN